MIGARWIAAGSLLTLGVVSGAGGGAGQLSATSRAALSPDAQAAEHANLLVPRSHAATLEGVQAAYHVVLNNIHNSKTIGFQAVRPLFEAWNSSDGLTSGVMRPQMKTTRHAGWPVKTNRDLDVCLEGSGFLCVLDPAAATGLAYGRSGHLTVDTQGFLAAGTPEGPALRLNPPVIVPQEAHALRVLASGRVQGQAPETQDWIDLGDIQLAAFAQPDLLQTAGHLLHATPEAGPPHYAAPGTHGLAALRVGSLEGSNVDLGVEAQELRFLRAWSKRLSKSLGHPDPLASTSTSNTAP
ncbi:MAG: hypothetical protein V3V20_06790 [Algisphaera sp.]